MTRFAFCILVSTAVLLARAPEAQAADDCPGICPLDHVCVQGACVPRAEAPAGADPVISPAPSSPSPAPTPTPAPGPATATTSTIPIEEHASVPIGVGVEPVPTIDRDPWERLFSLTVDPLGFGLYGPSLKFEVGTMISGYARVRFPNLGLVHVAQNIDDTEFDFGISAGGGIRGYIGRESQQGFLMGAGFEVAYTVRRSDGQNDVGESDAIWSTTSFMPGLEIGYRIVAASGFTFTVAGGAFYIVNVGFDLRGAFGSFGRLPPQPTDGEIWPILQLDLGYVF